MKSQIEKISTLGRKVNVEVPAAVVQTTFDKVFKEIQKVANVKGFRKGKVPLQTIKTLYREQAKQDVIQELIRGHYSQVVTENNLDPIGYPEFEFDDVSEAADFAFTANFEVRPEVALKKYEGLEVEKEKYTFDEARMTQVLDNIRAARATLVTVTDARPAQLGDVAVIDFEGSMDGAPLANGAGTDHNLELGSNSFIEGFEEGITGMTVGSTKTLNLKFPTPYHSADLAGKSVEFKVTLKELKKKELPELTEEFVKSLGGPADLEALKTSIRTDLEESETKRIDSDFKNRLMKVLVTNNPVDVPASMMKEQKDALVEDFKRRMSEQGMGSTDFEQYADKWDADFTTMAGDMIQASFLVDAIAEKENLRCTPADLEARYEQYAKQTGLDIERIKEWYRERDSINRLAYQITEEKVLELLASKAKIKEVEKSKLTDQKN